MKSLFLLDAKLEQQLVNLILALPLATLLSGYFKQKSIDSAAKII